MKKEVVIFWFRRDLRLDDNRGLSEALKSGYPVLPVFIFDKTILSDLSDPYDRRVDYLHQAVQGINSDLLAHGSGLYSFFDTPLPVFEKLTDSFSIRGVYLNRDYEPAAISRDQDIEGFLSQKGIPFFHYQDQVIFEKDQILSNGNTPYTVYTPYARKWKATLSPENYLPERLTPENFLRFSPREIIRLSELGFQKTDIVFKNPSLDEKLISTYDNHRDYPALDHTTRLGIALRFGTISIRKCIAFALIHNETWLNELIWREFFMQILWHFPRVVTESFRPEYDRIEWQNDEDQFDRWCNGKTGYPIVDAGMRQLNQTGFMHNRLRMITASFLTKHLLIDWRWGEAYFASKLLDYELSSNNGNWQWAAGCGCDAAPYFRIFNPSEQTRKFDKSMAYIRKWNPDFDAFPLVEPIVDHQMARERALKTYKNALNR